MTNKRMCPLCEAEAVEDWSEAESDGVGISGVGPPECPNGHGILTEENLLQTGDRVLGKSGLVISSGETDMTRMTSLLKTIRQLELDSQKQEPVVDLVRRSARKWNRQRARRLFHRWVKEANNNLPEIIEVDLRSLAERLIAEDQERVEQSWSWDNDDLVRWMETGLIDAVQRYEFRRKTEPILILATEIPEELHSAFDEAKECLRWGLNDASYALCRRVLDISLRSTWPEPVEEESFNNLVSKSTMLSGSEKKWLANFWRDSSNFIHGREEAKNAWLALEKIAAILERIAKHGGFANAQT